MTLVESMSARVHTTDCFHIQRHPGTIYKPMVRKQRWVRVFRPATAAKERAA